MDSKLYAFEHFKYHADQRIKVFNFFILLSIFIDGAVLTAYEKSLPYISISIMGALIYLTVIIFKILDDRSRSLIDISKKALIKLEKEEEEIQCKLFTLDFVKSRIGKPITSGKKFSNFISGGVTSNKFEGIRHLFSKGKHKRPQRRSSFTTAFNSLFFIQGLIGAIVFLTAMSFHTKSLIEEKSIYSPEKDKVNITTFNDENIVNELKGLKEAVKESRIPNNGNLNVKELKELLLKLQINIEEFEQDNKNQHIKGVDSTDKHLDRHLEIISREIKSRTSK